MLDAVNSGEAPVLRPHRYVVEQEMAGLLARPGVRFLHGEEGAAPAASWQRPSFLPRGEGLLFCNSSATVGRVSPASIQDEGRVLIAQVMGDQ
jgi:hypothetical protein